MGSLSGKAILGPLPIDQPLPWGPVLRGLRWGDGSDLALLLHDPDADMDAWGSLPADIAGKLGIETAAIDLPGHGLSDDPWEPSRLPDLLLHLKDVERAARLRFLIAAGDSSIAALEQASTLELSGLVCLSPPSPAHDSRPPRSPRVPKLFVVGSLAGSDLDDARRLATASGGWHVVTSYPVTERGTGLLASAWSRRLVEEVLVFLRDCQSGPARARLPQHGISPEFASERRGRRPPQIAREPGTHSRPTSEQGG